MFDDPLRVERVMSGTPATLFRTWAANWSCALPTAPRAGLPQPLVLGVQNVVVIVRGLQRASLFQVDGGQDSQPARAGWLLGPGLDVGDGGLDHMHCIGDFALRHAWFRAGHPARASPATTSDSANWPIPMGVADRRPGRRHQRQRRRSVGGGVDPPQVGSSTEGQTLGSGRLGPVRLLRLALPLLLGSAGCICCAPRARTTPRVGVDRGQRRRTRRADRDPLHHNYSRVQHQGIGDDRRRQ